jgi:hypothetical protein
MKKLLIKIIILRVFLIQKLPFELWRKKRKAMKLWRKCNEQFFIVPVDNWKGGKYWITSRKGIDLYNISARKIGAKEMTFNQTMRIIVFRTPIARPTRLM